MARTTAQKALRALVNDGLARVEKGWGVFVLPEEDRRLRDGLPGRADC